MAQIHLLPMRTDDGNACRQLQILTKAVTDGVDLGPRHLHIQAEGRELEALSIELRQLHTVLRAFSGSEAGKFVTLLDQMRALAERLETLAGLARSYLVGSSLPAGSAPAGKPC